MISDIIQNVAVILTENILLISFALIGIPVLWYLKSPAFKGSVGEHRVNSALRKRLDGNEYRILNDLTLPTPGGTTQIDHLIVSRFGVFVVETKNMQGWIFGKSEQPTWTQVIYGKKTRFQNPIRQNYKHVRTVQEMLEIDAAQIHSIVVFLGSSRPKTSLPENVVWSAGALVEYIYSRRTVVFAERNVNEMAETLANGSLEPGRKTRRTHIAHVKAQRARQVASADGCPRCGSEMIARTSRRTGESFLGCSRYPSCRGTR